MRSFPAAWQARIVVWRLVNEVLRIYCLIGGDHCECGADRDSSCTALPFEPCDNLFRDEAAGSADEHAGAARCLQVVDGEKTAIQCFRQSYPLEKRSGLARRCVMRGVHAAHEAKKRSSISVTQIAELPPFKTAMRLLLGWIFALR